MAGPVPIKPFVGGSISVEGRLAMGFDSYPQTLAVAVCRSPVTSTRCSTATHDFDGGDVIREGFYIDDLDAEGEDVPEVKLVTTLEAGAGVSIGIVTAGLKGGVTLTINLDLNDPNDDGRLRTGRDPDVFAATPPASSTRAPTIEASIAVFIEIELLFTSLEYEYDLLVSAPTAVRVRLRPTSSRAWSCSENGKLVLTSGNHAAAVPAPSTPPTTTRCASSTRAADARPTR